MTADAFAELTEPLPEPHLLLRLSGGIVAANRAAASLFGQEPERLAGAALQDHLADPPETVADYLRRCAAQRGLLPGRVTVRQPDGGAVACRVAGGRASPGTEPDPLLILRGQPGETRDRFQLLSRKIDELSHEIRRRMAVEEERASLLESEQQARVMAERANQLKDQFLATLSHELRTPLNAIVGWISLLRTGEYDPEVLPSAIETIGRAARAQTQMIEDLLDVSRITGGKLRLNLRPLNVSDIVRQSIETVRPAAEAKHIRLQVLLDPGAGPVSGDPDRLQQIVWNLLSNAVKFTPKGGRVQVRVERVNSHVDIIISDTGEGIAPDFLPYLFERFRQAEGSLTRTHQGLGLGLSIVKDLTEMHGGTVTVTSPGRGQGSTFTVKLPLLLAAEHQLQTDTEPPPAEHPRAELESLPAPTYGLEDVHVLVVEDDADSAELLVRMLERQGARATSVRSAAEALAAVRRERPDLILSDIEMPGEDGYALIRKVRALPPEQGGRTPAIAVTAFARAADRVRALQAGFQMHIAKPVQSEELVTVVASLTGRL